MVKFITQSRRGDRRSRNKKGRSFKTRQPFRRYLSSNNFQPFNNFRRYTPNHLNNIPRIRAGRRILPSKDSKVSYPVISIPRKLKYGYDQNGGYFPSFETNPSNYNKS